jgi:hypothetical protein
VATLPAREVAYTGLMVVVVVLLVILAAVSHTVLALVFRSQANAYDERDRLIGLRGARVAGYVLAAGVCAGIGLAMIQVDTFWIAETLIATLVIAEVIEGAVKLVLYWHGA